MWRVALEWGNDVIYIAKYRLISWVDIEDLRDRILEMCDNFRMR